MAQVIPNPPVRTGNAEQDFLAYTQWLESFYRSLVLERVANLAGNFTVSGADSEVTVDLPVAEVGLDQPDLFYSPVVSVASYTGTPDPDSFIVQSAVAISTTQFAVTLRAAPGVGSSVIFGFVVVRSQ